MVIGAAALVVAAASAAPSAIATSGRATAPVVGRAVGVTSIATAASARASRSETRTPLASVLTSPVALSGALAHGIPLTPFTESAAGGALGTTQATTVASTVATPAGAAVPAAAATQVAKPATSAVPARVVPKSVTLWVRPNGGPLSSPFGRRWGRMHKGIDLAGSYGSSIVAATAGTVYFTGPEQGYGRIIKVQDSDGTQTWYAHMSRYLVKPGDHVQAGQRIAFVGVAGDATGPNLHFEVHVGGQPVDPLPFLRKHGVRI
jgi:murein DD-endopeptidase MepM/ murein hydrolase activator NlpD